MNLLARTGFKSAALACTLMLLCKHVSASEDFNGNLQLSSEIPDENENSSQSENEEISIEEERLSALREDLPNYISEIVKVIYKLTKIQENYYKNNYRYTEDTDALSSMFADYNPNDETFINAVIISMIADARDLFLNHLHEYLNGTLEKSIIEKQLRNTIASIIDNCIRNTSTYTRSPLEQLIVHICISMNGFHNPTNITSSNTVEERSITHTFYSDASPTITQPHEPNSTAPLMASGMNWANELNDAISTQMEGITSPQNSNEDDRDHTNFWRIHSYYPTNINL